MATIIKSFTGLHQSKVLAEILPLESADMVLLHEEPYETSDSKFDGLHQALCVPFNKYDKSWRQKYKNISYFPCWSLAALLSVLPLPSLIQDKVDDELFWQCSSYDEDGTLLCETYDNNPIDACVEMIEKLHELNLLRL